MAESMNTREEQIRRRMLSIARLSQSAYEGGGVPFALFAHVKDDDGYPVDSDEMAERLLTELCEWGLLAELQSMVSGGTAPARKHRRFKFTTKGFQLWSREIPPVPGVADDRLEAR
jgi:hypothetical protein